jgi:hypothetical protein
LALVTKQIKALQTFFDYLASEAGLSEFLEDFPHLQVQVLQVLEVIVKRC